MSPGKIVKRIVIDRLDIVEEALRDIAQLPLQSYDTFTADRRNILSAESCLRRALEALFDIGRHILAKGFAVGVSEYKEIAKRLEENGVLSSAEAATLRTLAGYRNRMVHFYHEVSQQELYDICAHDTGDLNTMISAYADWLKAKSGLIDESL